MTVDRAILPQPETGAATTSYEEAYDRAAPRDDRLGAADRPAWEYPRSSNRASVPLAEMAYSGAPRLPPT